MVDRSVPNLPSRSLPATAGFYGALGFRTLHLDDDWLVLRRGDLQVEFFAKPDLDPLHHDFGCCWRVAELDALVDAVRAAGVPERASGHPSLQPIALAPWGQRMATVFDPDGNLLHLIEDAD